MSKAIYGVLKSRMNLSKANSWVEDNGDIFFYMPIDELSKMLTTSKATISRKLQELENVGLLERQHLASSRCHRMYLHQVESQTQVDPQIDENICTMFEYFDIFLGRMMMCRGAAEILGARFKLTANGSKVL